MSAPYIDNVMFRVLQNRFPHRYYEDKKVALIGEQNGQQRKGSLAHKMAQKIFTCERRNITVFTERRLFTVEQGEHYDLLVSVRSCDAEELVLKAATQYDKDFALLPCECGARWSNVKLLRYIREYPIINGIEFYPGTFWKDNGSNTYDSRAWAVIYRVKGRE